jgi:cytochrome P450
MDPSLRRGVVERTAPAVIEPIAAACIDAIAGRGEADLMAELFEPVSVLALGQVLGLGTLDAGTLRRWFAELAIGGANFEQDPAKQKIADAASAEIDAVCGPLLDGLERDPDGSLLAEMLHADPPGGRLTRSELLANLKLILLGGMQEPGHGAGIALWALLTHPEALADVLADPGLLPGAIEEALRWHSPVGTQTRQLTRDARVGDVDLPAGTALAAVLSSANRDERHWPDADRFDIRRAGASAAFGLGAHYCAGAWLARHELRVPLRLALERLPNLRLDPERPPELAGWEFRAPRSLHVLWDA